MANQHRLLTGITAAAFLISGCAAVSSEVSMEENIETVSSFDDMNVYIYARNEVLYGTKKVPLILYMCGTGCDPEEQPLDSGFGELANKEDLIVISPDYRNAATYSETERLVSLVEKVEEDYPVDAGRVYSLGFSNGGAASAALTSEYPRYFAGIAAYGWMVDLRNKDNGYQMPFQVVQGTREFTEQNEGGEWMVMRDEREAIRSLLIYDHLINEDTGSDYGKTPYWGYVPDTSYQENNDGVLWTINNYMKNGYAHPFAQFILVGGADHVPHKKEAEYSWDFLKHFSRNQDGSIEEDR